MNTCPMATAGCKAACLYTAGRAMIFPKIGQARVRKTVWLHENRAEFMAQLRKDIESLARRASKLGLRPAVRVNGTSDLPWMALKLATEFPDIQFYDYTKIPKPWQRVRANYHITFSLSENNKLDAIFALKHGVNVAVVFNTKKNQALPSTWEGYRVLQGDESDLRFLDSSDTGKGKGVVIGLYAKGRAKKDTSGFVQIAPMGGL
jgi:hypothetical protein